jgi:hypothetical protein
MDLVGIHRVDPFPPRCYMLGYCMSTRMQPVIITTTRGVHVPTYAPSPSYLLWYPFVIYESLRHRGP